MLTVESDNVQIRSKKRIISDNEDEKENVLNLENQDEANQVTLVRDPLPAEEKQTSEEIDEERALFVWFCRIVPVRLCTALWRGHWLSKAPLPTHLLRAGDDPNLPVIRLTHLVDAFGVRKAAIVLSNILSRDITGENDTALALGDVLTLIFALLDLHPDEALESPGKDLDLNQYIQHSDAASWKEIEALRSLASYYAFVRGDTQTADAIYAFDKDNEDLYQWLNTMLPVALLSAMKEMSFCSTYLLQRMVQQWQPAQAARLLNASLNEKKSHDWLHSLTVMLKAFEAGADEDLADGLDLEHVDSRLQPKLIEENDEESDEISLKPLLKDAHRALLEQLTPHWPHPLRRQVEYLLDLQVDPHLGYVLHFGCMTCAMQGKVWSTPCGFVDGASWMLNGLTHVLAHLKSMHDPNAEPLKQEDTNKQNSNVQSKRQKSDSLSDTENRADTSSDESSLSSTESSSDTKKAKQRQRKPIKPSVKQRTIKTTSNDLDEGKAKANFRGRGRQLSIEDALEDPTLLLSSQRAVLRRFRFMSRTWSDEEQRSVRLLPDQHFSLSLYSLPAQARYQVSIMYTCHLHDAGYAHCDFKRVIGVMNQSGSRVNLMHIDKVTKHMREAHPDFIPTGPWPTIDE